MSQTARKHNFSTRGQLIIDLTVFFSGLFLIYLFFVSGLELPPFVNLNIPWLALVPAGFISALALAAFVIDDSRLGYSAHLLAVGTYQMLVLGDLLRVNTTLALVVVTLLFIGSNLSRTLVAAEAGLVIVLSVASILLGDHSNTTIRNEAILLTILTTMIAVFGLMFSRHFTGQRIESKGRVTSDPRLDIDAVLGSVADGIIIIDSKGIITAFNPEASRITGWSTSDTLGIHHRFIIRFVDKQGRAQDSEDNPITAASIKGKFDSKDLLLLTEGGEQLPVSIKIIQAKMSHQDSFIVVIRDISEETSDSRNKADFVSTASHEMRTPIASIEGYLALAMNPKVTQMNPKTAELVEKAYESTRHLGQLFKDLLETTEATDGRMKLNPTVVNINDMLLDMKDNMLMIIGTKQLNLSFYLGTERLETDKILPQYQCNIDKDRIMEAIMNIFDNAVKYTKTGGIAIIINADSNSVVISVKDTGLGIPKEDIPHMFQKFYRVDNGATRAIGGTGLGLFLTKSIVENSGGTVWVDSVEGSGSTFHIRLPRWDNITNSGAI